MTPEIALGIIRMVAAELQRMDGISDPADTAKYKMGRVMAEELRVNQLRRGRILKAACDALEQHINKVSGGEA